MSYFTNETLSYVTYNPIKYAEASCGAAAQTHYALAPCVDTWHAAAARALGCLPSQLVQCKQVDADGIERIWWVQKPV